MSNGTEIATIVVLSANAILGFVSVMKLLGNGGQGAKKKQEEYINELFNNCAPQYLEDIHGDLREIKFNLQNIQNSNTDLLRREINKIYSKYRPYKTITQYDKSDVTKLSTDYFAEHGNSYVEDLIEQMSKWDVVNSVDEIEGFEERR